MKLSSDNTDTTINKSNTFTRFTDELRPPRMHWPTRAESTRAVAAVLTLLVLAAALTGLVDVALTDILDPLMR